MQRRLFIVSNRLPVTIEKGNSSNSIRVSSGGLVSAINAYLDKESDNTFDKVFWAGVADCGERAWNDANKGSDCPYDFLPLFVKPKLYDQYYSGFSNSLLWPLFHYFPSFADFTAANYEAYMKVNEDLATLLSKQLQEGDYVWIHDYHLLPLAGLLRKNFPNLLIGFFLHVPFPSYELFRVIPKPWQQSLLSGMLGADLVGFHTKEYATHFIRSVKEVFRAEVEHSVLVWNNRKVKIDAFPISIDYQQFNESYLDAGVMKERRKYLNLKGEKKLLFSVDRLDYTKGISNRLKGFERFLLKFPEYHGKVLFALVLVPSRDSIQKYAERKKMIDEFIGGLNSKLGTISWQPIIYQYGHLNFEELNALYTSCDLALITPLRDGMNLVAKEFVASRKDKRGVLVLSEMAGAANELREALLINPNDTNEIAEMIKTGLEMSDEEQEERMIAMQQTVSSYDIHKWASDFLGKLGSSRKNITKRDAKFMDNATRASLLDKYAVAKKRLILLDYDGTLTPFCNRPEMATPGPEVLSILTELAKGALNDVYIISGRDSNTLEKWFGELNVGLVAEHGAKLKMKNEAWKTMTGKAEAYWKADVQQILQQHLSDCPGAFIEEKEFSLAWHYRNAEPLSNAKCIKYIYKDLRNLAQVAPIDVISGNKVIEARVKGINKGQAAEYILNKEKYDFVLAIGDDRTDEDMFKRLAELPGAFTVKVGAEATNAKFRLHNPGMTQTFLYIVSLFDKNNLN